MANQDHHYLGNFVQLLSTKTMKGDSILKVGHLGHSHLFFWLLMASTKSTFHNHHVKIQELLLPRPSRKTKQGPISIEERVREFMDNGKVSHEALQ